MAESPADDDALDLDGPRRLDLQLLEAVANTDYSLATAEKLLACKPVDAVERISPRAIMFIAAEPDAATSADDAVDIFDRAGDSK